MKQLVALMALTESKSSKKPPISFFHWNVDKTGKFGKRPPKEDK